MVLEFENTFRIGDIKDSVKAVLLGWPFGGTLKIDLDIRATALEVHLTSAARLMGSETCPKAPSRAQPCPDPGHNR